jgi:1,4-dihydroxy-2-naphthoyl-CoA synthase
LNSFIRKAIPCREKYCMILQLLFSMPGMILLQSLSFFVPQAKKAFCAGASFDELVEIKNEKEGLAFFSGFAHVINSMRLCPRFIIGRIHGKCVGGGVGLAASVDYAIASEAAE